MIQPHHFTVTKMIYYRWLKENCNSIDGITLRCIIIYNKTLYYDQCLEDRGRFGRGCCNVSLLSLPLCLFPQLPRTGYSAAEPCTLSETVFKQNWCTVGLSLRPPAALCFPKKDSTGSWQSFSERIYSTPGTDNKYCVISTNEYTA